MQKITKKVFYDLDEYYMQVYIEDYIKTLKTNRNTIIIIEVIQD